MRFLRSLFGRFLGQRGQSVIEAVMAVAVLGIAAQTGALLVRAMVKQNVSDRDRILATEKALQMLEELRGLVLTGNATLTTLDTYDDGFCNTCSPSRPYYKWTLTTKTSVTQNVNTGQTLPDYSTATDPHSNNPVRPGGFAFVRYVDINSTTKDANMRTIYVRVYAAASNPGPVSSTQTAMPAAPTAPPLAEVYGVVHSQGAVVTQNQVLDVYFVGLENVPGWWSRTSNLIPLMQSSVVSIQAINPGLTIRAHWIQTMSFGRDLEYTPETNATTNSVTNTGSLQQTYVYPGYIDYDYPSASNDFYYLPRWFLGRLNVGGTMGSGYPMADQFNHAMRYPDEQNLYNVLCTIAQNQGAAAPQISWRMLLELLNENDPSVQNAIVLNLHGEMVPVPPLRNYSDAAKDPEYYQNTGTSGLPSVRSFRVVSQPEQLLYATGSSPAVDVYAYDANPSEIPTSVSPTPATGSDADPAQVINTVTLFIPGAKVANLSKVYRTQGNSLTPYYRFVSSTASGFNYLPSAASATAITDGPGPLNTYTSATFYADNFTPSGRASGLRIQLFGTTPTARPFFGSEYSTTVSP